MSSLRAKLNSMKSPGPRPESRARPGLKVLTYEEPADSALYGLDPRALERMGLSGGSFDVEDALFLDAETTGLSGGAGTVVFLVGVGYIREGCFFVEQYLMRDYGDEVKMLTLLSEKLRDHKTLVTFNGKAFDMPLLKGRFTISRMGHLYRELENLDLLFPARRLWRLRLGNCKLSTLEADILGRGRENDVPGSEVPKRFFDYLKTGDEGLLTDVIEHNRLDIVSMAALLSALAEAYAKPDLQKETADLFSMGRALQKLGDVEAAASCYEKAAKPGTALSIKALKDSRISAEAGAALSLLYKRRGDVQKAMSIWRNMAKRGPLAPWARIEMAKVYEHRLKDYAAALEIAEAALKLNPGDEEEKARIERRIQRLRGKMGR